MKAQPPYTDRAQSSPSFPHLYKCGNGSDARKLPPDLYKCGGSACDGERDAVSNGEANHLRTLNEITEWLKREAANPERIVEEVMQPDEWIDPKENAAEENAKDDRKSADEDHNEGRWQITTKVGGRFVSHDAFPSNKTE